MLVGGIAAVLVLYPIAYLVQASLSVGDPQARPPEAYGLDNFTGLGRYAHIFGNTLLVAALATVLAVIVGFTMGWILSRTNVPGRAAFEQLMAMPYYVTPLMGPSPGHSSPRRTAGSSIRSGGRSGATATWSTSTRPAASRG